ncbi:hypothetical protein NDU88_002754, partial [Pleurodeles waltl]
SHRCFSTKFLHVFLFTCTNGKCLAFRDPALVSHPFLSLTGRRMEAQKIVK